MLGRFLLTSGKFYIHRHQLLIISRPPFRTFRSPSCLRDLCPLHMARVPLSDDAVCGLLNGSVLSNGIQKSIGTDRRRDSWQELRFLNLLPYLEKQIVGDPLRDSVNLITSYIHMNGPVLYYHLVKLNSTSPTFLLLHSLIYDIYETYIRLCYAITPRLINGFFILFIPTRWQWG